METIGALDIGTISVRGAVATLDQGTIFSLDKRTRICDLGVGVDATGQLDPAAIARVVTTIKDHLAFMAEEGCKQAICLLTSAARDAQNIDELLEPLADLGVVPQVIGGQVEGALTFTGASEPYPSERLMVADLGGGSLELAVSAGPAAEGALSWVHSFDLGARRLTDRYGLAPAAPSKEAVAQCLTDAQAELAAELTRQGYTKQSVDRLVVTGGTATTLVAMKLELDPYDPLFVQGARLMRSDVQAAAELLASRDVEGRMQLTGVQPKRAATLLGGALLLQALMQAADVDQMYASEFDGLRGACLAAYRATKGIAGPFGFMPTVFEVKAR